MGEQESINGKRAKTQMNECKRLIDATTVTHIKAGRFTRERGNGIESHDFGIKPLKRLSSS